MGKKEIEFAFVGVVYLVRYTGSRRRRWDGRFSTRCPGILMATWHRHVWLQMDGHCYPFFDDAMFVLADLTNFFALGSHRYDDVDRK